MARLWRYSEETKEGKYLVKRRDGSVPRWPHFVIGGADPVAPWALRFYAVVAFLMRFDWAYVRSVWRFAGEMKRWRRENGTGDPDAPRHRVDDPATVAEMRKAMGA